MFKVLVDDNFHHMDKDERYALGEFEDWLAAVSAAKRLVDEFLAAHYKPGMSAADLYAQYTGFGEDPFVVPQPEGCEFSAWRYAHSRCDAICGAERSA